MEYIQAGNHLSKKLQEFIRTNITGHDRMKVVLKVLEEIEEGNVSDHTVVGMLTGRTKMPRTNTDDYNKIIIELLRIAIPNNTKAIQRRTELAKLYAEQAA